MNCKILFEQALLKSRELLLPTLFPNSYPKDRILIQNYVAVIILLHSITLHVPFKRVGSSLLILCSGSMTITNLKEIQISLSNFCSTTHIMKIIKENGSNLHTIILENFKFDYDIENLKLYFEDQFPVIIKRNFNLILN